MRLAATQSIGSLLRDLSFPLAVKALPEDSDHKTDAGLVVLGIRTTQELDEAVGRLRTRLRPGADLLVQEMVSDGVEALLAARLDPDFGPVLAIGAGGTRVELLADIAYLVLPASVDDIRQALNRLQFGEVLRGFRGRPPADTDALVSAAARLGQAFLGYAGRLAELELNPLFVRHRGEGVIAVDVLSR
jgi:hypothetical protein